MNVDSYIDGKLKIYDDVFPIEIIRELEVENSSLLFSFGAYDLLVLWPMGWSCCGLRVLSLSFAAYVLACSRVAMSKTD